MFDRLHVSARMEANPEFRVQPLRAGESVMDERGEAGRSATYRDAHGNGTLC